MIMLRKPTKLDYTNPSTYQPIALLNMMTKVLSTCVAEHLVQAAKTCDLLPSNHFGCHPRRTTTDSFHYLTTFIKDMWRKKVVSTLFLDIKAMFPNVVLSQLI